MNHLPVELQAEILYAAARTDLKSLHALSGVNRRLYGIFKERRRQLLIAVAKAFIPASCLKPCQTLMLLPVTRFIQPSNGEQCECCGPNLYHRDEVLQETVEHLDRTSFALERMEEAELEATIRTHAIAVYLSNWLSFNRKKSYGLLSYTFEGSILDKEWHERKLNLMYELLIWNDFFFISTHFNPRMWFGNLFSGDDEEMAMRLGLFSEALASVLGHHWYREHPPGWPHKFLSNATLEEVFEVFSTVSVSRKLAVLSSVGARDHGVFEISPLWQYRQEGTEEVGNADL